MTQLTENIFAGELPDKVENLNLYRINNYAIMLEWDDIERPLNPHTCVKVDEHHGDLKEYTWPKILCTTKEATPEQIQDIIDWRFESAVRIRFRNYLGGESDYSCQYSSESLNSLLTSKGLDVNKNYVLLKKK